MADRHDADRNRDADGGFDDPDYRELSTGYGVGGYEGHDAYGGRYEDDPGRRRRGGRRHGRSAGERDVPWTYLEPWAVPGPFTGRGPEGYTRSQDAIRDDVCERLTRHGELDASGIRVRVEEGEVVLEGTVDSRHAKRLAEDTAESVSGVRDVHNRLRIARPDDR